MSENKNYGTISRVKDKKSSSHADARGKCNIEGVEYWINGWSKTGRYGPYMSLSFKKKEQQPEPAPKSEPEENGKKALPEEKKDESLF